MWKRKKRTLTVVQKIQRERGKGERGERGGGESESFPSLVILEKAKAFASIEQQGVL